MYAKLIRLLLALAPALATGQCPEFQLTDLHALQRASLDDKSEHIKAQGFDLRSSFVQNSETIYSYSKCWNSNYGDKSVFEQLIWWNVHRNSITFMTLNESHFKSLRSSIINRHGAKTVTENPDFYLGQIFKYNFGSRRVDGFEYFSIQISFR